MKIILQKDSRLNDQDIKKIKDLGFSIEYYEFEETEGDIYIGYPRSPFLGVDNIKGLKFIQSLMAGYDHLDLQDMEDKDIILANASGISSVPIAEYVILKILDFYKKAQFFRENQKLAFWGKRPENEKGIQELTNQTAIILGTGNIGSEIAKRLQVFGVNVIGINSDGRKIKYFDQTYALKDLNENLAKANIVIGALPLNPITEGLYDKKFFENMDQNAIFINVGRGSQLKTNDLLEVVDNHLGHVYLDVLPSEPLDPKSKLWSHSKISISPHIAASSDYIRERIIDLILTNLVAFRDKTTITNRVI